MASDISNHGIVFSAFFNSETSQFENNHSIDVLVDEDLEMIRRSRALARPPFPSSVAF